MANPLESRRNFLKASAATLGALGLAAMGVEGAESAEKPKPIALGVLMTTEGVNPAILGEVSKPTYDVPKGLSYVGGIEIAGTRGYNYLVSTEKGLVEIPLDLVTVMQGDPFPVEKKTSFLGIRNDIVEFMPFVDLAGMTSVRISRDVEEITNRNSMLVSLIKEALTWKYRPLVVFNTRYPRPVDEVRQMARDLVIEYDVDVEILNEPNEAKYWKDGDLETAADVIKITSDEIKKHKPKTRVIVAALTDPNKMAPFVKLLKQRGVNFNQVEFAAHGYGEPWVVEWVVREVVKATGKPAVVTEFGVEGENKREIIPILDKLWQMRAKGWVTQAYFHELHDFEGWGIVNPFLGIVKPSFYFLPAWIRNHSDLAVNSPLKKSKPKATPTPTATPVPTPRPVFRSNKGEGE